MNARIPWKYIVVGLIFLFTLVMSPMLVGVNNAGYRTVVQYPNGTLEVKFEPGFYAQWFGNTTTYPDIITYDFDKTAAEGEASLDVNGITVRYQDGGTGSIFGKARFILPGSADDMIKIHKAFRSTQGVAYKLIKPTTDEAQNLTAGLMTSEEAYAEKRGTFTEWSRDQVSNGKYQTELNKIDDVDASGKHVIRNIPIIKYAKDGTPARFDSDLKAYGIAVSGYQITDWNFEPKTLAQISKKREATMAIITSKADAERAKQEAITAEAQGQKNVMTAKYEKEVEKEKAVVDAMRKKEVAVIAAEQLVAVAEQQKLEQEQKKLGMLEYEKAEKARGRGDAAYKQMLLEADGALQAKLDAMVQMNKDTSVALANRAVPQYVVYSSTGENGTQLGTDGDVRNVLNTQLLKNVQALGVNMQPKH